MIQRAHEFEFESTINALEAQVLLQNELLNSGAESVPESTSASRDQSTRAKRSGEEAFKGISIARRYRAAPFLKKR